MRHGADPALALARVLGVSAEDIRVREGVSSINRRSEEWV